MVTRCTMNFYFPLLIECPCVRSLDRFAFRLSRIVKCQSLYQRERNRPSPPLSSHQFWNRNCSTDFAVAGQRGFPGIVYPEKFRNREARFKCLECTFGAATIPAGVTAPPCTCNFLFTSIAN